MAEVPGIKCFAMIFNIISLLVGIPTFAGGLWIYSDQKRQGMTQDTSLGAYSLPVAGALLTVNGPLGYYGIIKKSKGMLGLFFFFLLLIFAAEMDVGISVIKNKDKLQVRSSGDKTNTIDTMFNIMLLVTSAGGIGIQGMIVVMIIVLLYWAIKKSPGAIKSMIFGV